MPIALSDDNKKEILSIVDEYIKSKSIPSPESIAELEELRSGKAITDEKLAKVELDSQSLLESIKQFLTNNFNVDLADDMSAEMFSEMVKTISIDDAVWTTAYVNNLPDSSFFYISAGGEKDEERKTTPRSLRHLPYKGEDGKVDLPHLRNAIARAGQVKGLAEEKAKSIQARAQKMLARMQDAGKSKMDESEFGEDIQDLFGPEMDDAAQGFVPTPGMASAAKRALEWRGEFKRGGTGVGVARARDIMNKKELSPSTVMRMKSFFARHEVDKKASGFSQGEEGFPSAGRIAWDLWGGDGGKTWAHAKAAQIERMRAEDSVKGPWVMGDFVYNEPAPIETAVEDAYTPEKTYTTPSKPTFAVGDFVAYRLDSKGNEVGVSSGSLGEQDDAVEMKEGYGVIDAMHSKGVVTHGINCSVEGSEEDPATILTIAKMNEDGLYDKTEEVVVKKASELRKIMAPIVWSKKETPPLGAYPAPGIGG